MPQQSKTSRAARLTAVLKSPAARSCGCGITAETTQDQLMAMGCGCTNPLFCCPTLDAARRVTRAYIREEDDNT